jgi:hypothetical protein
MPNLPDLRANIATWAVPTHAIPAVSEAMLRALPAEQYDPAFRGQKLETTYFDTRNFALRKARRQGDKYLTLRLRCYESPDGSEFYALSAKTEKEKFRTAIHPDAADQLLSNPELVTDYLPGNLLARLAEIADDDDLLAVVTVCAHRYAREDDTDRLTLDLHVHTDTGKQLPSGVLEFKSTQADAEPPQPLAVLGLRPIKLSKFLWATLWR